MPTAKPVPIRTWISPELHSRLVERSHDAERSLAAEVRWALRTSFDRPHDDESPKGAGHLVPAA